MNVRYTKLQEKVWNVNMLITDQKKKAATPNVKISQMYITYRI